MAPRQRETAASSGWRTTHGDATLRLAGRHAAAACTLSSSVASAFATPAQRLPLPD
jgi:hypothetical protein